MGVTHDLTLLRVVHKIYFRLPSCLEFCMELYLKDRKPCLRSFKAFILFQGSCMSQHFGCRRGLCQDWRFWIGKSCFSKLFNNLNYQSIRSNIILMLFQDDTNQYVMRSLSTIPFKWFAIESLKHYCFTSQSDVWSFGVVMWEMFSFGKTPFLRGIVRIFNNFLNLLVRLFQKIALIDWLTTATAHSDRHRKEVSFIRARASQPKLTDL